MPDFFCHACMHAWGISTVWLWAESACASLQQGNCDSTQKACTGACRDTVQQGLLRGSSKAWFLAGTILPACRFRTITVCTCRVIARNLFPGAWLGNQFLERAQVQRLSVPATHAAQPAFCAALQVCVLAVPSSLEAGHAIARVMHTRGHCARMQLCVLIGGDAKHHVGAAGCPAYEVPSAPGIACTSFQADACYLHERETVHPQQRLAIDRGTRPGMHSKMHSKALCIYKWLAVFCSHRYACWPSRVNTKLRISSMTFKPCASLERGTAKQSSQTLEPQNGWYTTI